VLLAIDLDRPDSRAASYAVQLAARLKLSLVLMAVFPARGGNPADPGDISLGGLAEEQSLWLGKGERCQQEGVNLEVFLAAGGDPAEEILNLANEGMYDLIVLGSQGRSSLRGFLLGSVHAKILHHALQPVLLMRNFRPIQKILVAYRGSQCDQGALEFIAPLFAKQKPEITILHVQETALGETAEIAAACLLTGEDTLKAYGYTPSKKLARGDFVDEILKAVAMERYDLLVLGAYAHKRPKYLKMIRDEALNLVRLSTRPVLVYRDQAETWTAALGPAHGGRPIDRPPG